MAAVHLEGTEAPSFPANELGSNWKKTQLSHHLIIFLFFFFFLIEQALVC